MIAAPREARRNPVGVRFPRGAHPDSRAAAWRNAADQVPRHPRVSERLNGIPGICKNTAFA